MAQSIAMVGQFLLAFWLTPSDYGLWASASALTSLLIGLTNFGEANRFLADGRPIRESLRTCLWANLPLALTGLVIALVSWRLTGSGTIALLVAGASLHIPVLGASNLLYVALVRARDRRSLIVGQTVAAAVRVLAAAAVAYATRSPLAFVAALWVSSLLTLLIYGLAAQRRKARDTRPVQGLPRDRVNRSAWAVQSVAAILATQADYLALTAIGSTHLLGLYFFAYQATVALTSIVANPVAKSTLSELSVLPPAERGTVAASLLKSMFLGSGALSLVAIVAALTVHHWYDFGVWSAAPPVIAILMSSVPSRLMVPIIDGFQLADLRVRANSRINLVDAAGTAAAALTGVTGDVVLTAAAVCAWKFAISAARVYVALRGRVQHMPWPLVIGPALLGCILMLAVASTNDAARVLAFGLAGAILVLSHRVPTNLVPKEALT